MNATNETTINTVTVKLSPATTAAREGRDQFNYNRLDVAQFADGETETDKARAQFESLGMIAGYPVIIAMVQQSLDRAFQAAQKEAGKDTLTADNKLQAAMDYMLIAKFGVSRTSTMSPAERILKEFESTKTALGKQLKAKTITPAQFSTQITTAITKMQTDLLAIPTTA